jgi:prophage antirepressor-like protein
MEALMKILSDHFDGMDVQVVWIEGRPHWTYETASRLAGHSDPRVTMNLVARDDELSDPSYTVTLTGQKFREFRKIGSAFIAGMSAKARRLTLFTEAGLWLLIDKSDSKVGRKYRKLFCTQVAPQIARDGRYLPEREVTPEGRMVDRAQSESARLAVERERLEFERRKLAADGLWRLCDVLKNAPYLSQEIKDSLAVKAAEEASGRSLAGLLPPADASYQWESPTQIAERLGAGITANAVGKAITALGLRGVEGMSRAVLNKASHSDRTVTTYLYSPEAVAQIEKHLRANGHARAA